MKNNKQRSKKREKEIANDIGGRAHAASGALWFKKSDASNAHFQVEDKFTDKDFYTLNISSLKKIEKEALSHGKTPIFRFGFTDGKFKEDYALLRINDSNKLSDIYGIEKIVVDKKSVRLYSEKLKFAYLCSNSYAIMLITFNITNNTYILIQWDDFLLHQDYFKGVDNC